MTDLLRITSVSQFHELLGLPAPQHPLISFINEDEGMNMEGMDDALFNVRFTSDMYTVMFKDKVSGSLGYGRSSYDFQEGTLIFGSPGQVFTSPKKEQLQGNMGWTLLFHPDLLLKSPLSHNIDSFTYFSYEVNEALHLSDKEAKRHRRGTCRARRQPDAGGPAGSCAGDHCLPRVGARRTAPE